MYEWSRAAARAATAGVELCGALASFRETLGDLAPVQTDATEKWSYDAFGNMTDYFDAKASGGGPATQHVAYDGDYQSFPLAIANALGQTSQFHFDPALGEVERALTPGGHLRCFVYDEFGRLAERDEHADTFTGSIDDESPCETPVAAFSFDSLGDPESQRIVESLYPSLYDLPIEQLRYFDGLGREYQTENRHRYGPATFDVVSRAWGTRGEPACETLPFRRVGQVEDSAIVPCLGQAPRRETTYDEMLRPVRIERVEPGGRVTEVLSEYAIDGFGLTSSAGSLLVERRTTIGGGGASGDPTPDRVQLFGLDNRGQVVVLREGADAATTTTLERDPKGRITHVDGPDVAITSGGVDQNLLEIAYNAVDQRTLLSQPKTPGDASAPTWHFTYDADGDLYEETSPRGVTTRYHHDALRRLALKDYGPEFSGSPASPGPGDIVYEYYGSGPGVGQLSRVYGRHGIETDLGYDWRGRVASKTRDYWGSMQFTFGYSYDLLDRPTFTLLPDSSSLMYTYDGAQLAQVESRVWLSETQHPSDVLAGMLDTHPSGGLASLWMQSPLLNQAPVFSSYTYRDEDYRLGSATAVRDPYGWYGAPETIQQLVYDYDTAGNLRSSDDQTGDPGDLDQAFAYDALHRLAEVATQGSHAYGLHRYAYDAAGNLLQKGPPGGTGELALHYDRTPGQPTHVASVDYRNTDGQWLAGFGAYQADADGGITSRRQLFFTTSFWRNPDGRIQTVTLPAPNQSAVYHYDDTGARSEKLELGIYASVQADRYSVDPGYEVDTVNDTHEVHLFVGGRRVATSLRAGLGNAGGGSTTSVTSVTTYHPDQVGARRGDGARLLRGPLLRPVGREVRPRTGWTRTLTRSSRWSRSRSRLASARSTSCASSRVCSA